MTQDSVQMGLGSGTFPTPPRPDRLTDSVFDLIRDAIINKTIEPGSAITEVDLATKLQVSKTPVREAMIRLREIGLLVQDGRRLRVITPSRKGIEDAYEFRLTVEPAAARLAARRSVNLSHDDVAASALRSSDNLGNETLAAYYQAGRDFHLAVSLASGNALFASAVERSHLYTLTLLRRDLSARVDQLSTASHHMAIAKAIESGDEDQAGEVMERHLHELMTSALERFDHG